MANKKTALMSNRRDFDITVNPATTYAGEQALPYVTAAVKSNDTIAKGYVRQMDGLTSKAVISSLNTTDPIVAAACAFNDAGTTTLGERVLTVTDLKVNREVCRKTLYPTWVGKNMTQNGGLPASFEDFLLQVVAGQASAQIENGIWVADAGGIFGAGFLSDDGVFDQNGLNASATADFTQVTMNAGAATSATNIDDALATVYASVTGTHPGLEFKQGFGFYMNNKMFSFYAQFLAGTGNGQGINSLGLTLNPDTLSYLGHPIYRCPGMPDDAIVATYKDNLVVGSNLGTDMLEASLIPTYMYDGSDNIRVVMNFGLGVQSGIGTDGVVGCIF
tara:strand:+ start:1010 stop:2008 length:999 start_codon:yes stop_codon:yes gene_type:complete